MDKGESIDVYSFFVQVFSCFQLSVFLLHLFNVFYVQILSDVIRDTPVNVILTQHNGRKIRRYPVTCVICFVSAMREESFSFVSFVIFPRSFRHIIAHRPHTHTHTYCNMYWAKIQKTKIRAVTTFDKKNAIIYCVNFFLIYMYHV